jgi:hypothetical protein
MILWSLALRIVYWIVLMLLWMEVQQEIADISPFVWLFLFMFLFGAYPQYDEFLHWWRNRTLNWRRRRDLNSGLSASDNWHLYVMQCETDVSERSDL